MYQMDAKKVYGEKAGRQLHKNTARFIEQLLEATPNKTMAVCSPASHHENYSG